VSAFPVEKEIALFEGQIAGVERTGFDFGEEVSRRNSER